MTLKCSNLNKDCIPHNPLFRKDGNIELPQKITSLTQALFPLHRQIDSQYESLPWPKQLQNIVVLTEVKGGRGDVAAAAKAIDLMQKLCPTLTFDWILTEANPEKYDPRSFLSCDNPSKVNVRFSRSKPSEESPGDLLLTGPVKLGWEMDYIESLIGRKISGPTFGFTENGSGLSKHYSQLIQKSYEKISREKSTDQQIYQDLHSTLFPVKFEDNGLLLPMGLNPGTGVFIDISRTESPLSREYCCPSYLCQIQDKELRKDILQAMNVCDEASTPDYDQYSLNFGYAHHFSSWGKFIDCIAMHEKTKHTIIVLNQEGEFRKFSTQEFQDQIFSPERLAFVQKQGYDTISLKGEEPKLLLLQESKKLQKGRRLTVIVRRAFKPSDVKCLQLASERLLATGDNTAVESWCARCKLYFYEDVANGGPKATFLKQQVALADKISPNLATLLNLFGANNNPLDQIEMKAMEEILSDPNLSRATVEFCNHIISNYSFHSALIAGLKRTAWTRYIPKLTQIEAEALDESFRSGLIDYLKNQETSEKKLCFGNITKIGERVQDAVKEYLSKQPQF